MQNDDRRYSLTAHRDASRFIASVERHKLYPCTAREHWREHGANIWWRCRPALASNTRDCNVLREHFGSRLHDLQYTTTTTESGENTGLCSSVYCGLLCVNAIHCVCLCVRALLLCSLLADDEECSYVYIAMHVHWCAVDVWPFRAVLL